MKDFHFDAISAFENYEIKEMKDGHVCSDDKSSGLVSQLLWLCPWRLSLYPCDQISGLVLISLGLDVVTLQSSINYLKAGKLDDVLTIKENVSIKVAQLV